MSSLFVGLMSGTSLDGADAALVEFDGPSHRTLAFAAVPFPDALRDRILALCEAGSDPLELEGLVSLELAQLYARAVHDVLAASGITRDAIVAIGCHGQTVRHRPDLGFTIQVNDPARLAELTGIDVVADIRHMEGVESRRLQETGGIC